LQLCLRRALASEHWSVQATSKRVAIKAAQLLYAFDPEGGVDVLIHCVERQARRIEASCAALERQRSRHWQQVLRGEADVERQWLLQLAGILVQMAPTSSRVNELLPSSLLECLSNGSDRIRKEAVSIVGQLNVGDPLIVEGLIQVLREEKRQEILIAVVRVLLRLPSDDPRIAEGLMLCLEDATKKDMCSLSNMLAEAVRKSSACRASESDEAASSSRQAASVTPGCADRPEACDRTAPDIPDSWDM